MYNLKREYDKIIKQKEKISNEMNQLEEDENVKRYLELKRQSQNLYDKQLYLYESIKMEEYESCSHILVYSKIDCDRLGGHIYRRCGCIKCRLDNSILDNDRKYLSIDEKIMYNYLMKNNLNGTHTKLACDIVFAHTIYSKIKDAYPDIDDKTTIEYFEKALDDIRNINRNDEQNVDRTKKLSFTCDSKK